MLFRRSLPCWISESFFTAASLSSSSLWHWWKKMKIIHFVFIFANLAAHFQALTVKVKVLILTTCTLSSGLAVPPPTTSWQQKCWKHLTPCGEHFSVFAALHVKNRWETGAANDTAAFFSRPQWKITYSLFCSGEKVKG